MKLFNRFLCALISAGIAQVAVANTVAVEARYVFIPHDANDDDALEIVVDGNLPNSCYQTAPSEINIDLEQRVIMVQPRALVSSGPCLVALFPFTEVLHVGSLPRGSYIVRAAGAVERVFSVNAAPSGGQVEEGYLPIDRIEVDVNAKVHRVDVTIYGRFSRSCMALDRVTVHDFGDSYRIDPFMKIEPEACIEGEVIYDPIKIELPWPAVGRYLVLVRGAANTSFRSIFSVVEE